MHPQNTYKPTAALTGLVFEGTPGTIDIIEFWEAAEERLTLHRVTDAATQVRELFWALKGSAKAAVGAQWSDPAECSLEELKRYLLDLFSPSWNAGASLGAFLHMEVIASTATSGTQVLADARLASRKMKQRGFPTTPWQELGITGDISH
jgi:hypothetical protein